MDMPQVKKCNAEMCAFNKNHACHALAITVGDQHAARCDTFWDRGTEGGDVREIGRVGACKMEDCEYNHDLCCTAPGIEVRYNNEGPVCVTYNPIKAHAIA